MDWYHLLYIVPAIFSGSTLLSYLSPVKVSARLVPLLTFITALIVLALPLSIDLALAVVPAVAVLHRFFGVSLSGHAPLGVTNLLRMGKGLQTEITEFASKAYPRPGEDVDTAVTEPDADMAVDTDVPVVKSAEKPQVKSFIPSL